MYCVTFFTAKSCIVLTFPTSKEIREIFGDDVPIVHEMQPPFIEKAMLLVEKDAGFNQKTVKLMRETFTQESGKNCLLLNELILPNDIKKILFLKRTCISLDAGHDIDTATEYAEKFIEMLNADTSQN